MVARHLSQLLDTSAAGMAALLKLRSRAHLAVRYAVNTGRLRRPSRCPDCGRKAPLDGHHEDYADPLAVTWRCRRCHAKRSKVIRAKALELVGDGRRRTALEKEK
jgi:hypothetical protein